MLWFIAVFAVIFQLTTPSSALQCLHCGIQTLQINTVNSINTTGAGCRTQDDSSTVCTASLNVHHAQASADVTFGSSLDTSYNELNRIKMIRNRMDINLADGTFNRYLLLYCFNNRSCLDDTVNVYAKSKYLK
jgi:hypothetical protein